jgi:hypothetical protein
VSICQVRDTVCSLKNYCSSASRNSPSRSAIINRHRRECILSQFNPLHISTDFSSLGSVFYRVTPISMHHKWPIDVKFPSLNVASIIEITRLARFHLMFLKKGVVIGKVDREEMNFTRDLRVPTSNLNLGHRVSRMSRFVRTAGACGWL